MLICLLWEFDFFLPYILWHGFVYQQFYADNSTHHMGFTHIYIQIENSDEWHRDSWNIFFSFTHPIWNMKLVALFFSALCVIPSPGFRCMFAHQLSTVCCLQTALFITDSICYWCPSHIWHCKRETWSSSSQWVCVYLMPHPGFYVAQEGGDFFAYPNTLPTRHGCRSYYRWDDAKALLYLQYFLSAFQRSQLFILGTESSLIYGRYETSRWDFTLFQNQVVLVACLPIFMSSLCGWQLFCTLLL